MENTFPITLSIPGTNGATLRRERDGIYGTNIEVTDLDFLGILHKAAKTSGVWLDTSGIECNKPTIEAIGNLASLKLFQQASTVLAETKKSTIPA